MKISKQDKERLIILCVMLFIIAFVASVFWGVRLIPFKWVIVFTLAAEIFFFMPCICQKYYQVHGIDFGVKPWIPFYNMIAIFEPTVAVLCLVCGIIFIVCTFFVLAPVELYLSVIPRGIAMSFPSVVSGLFIIIAVVMNFVIAYGYLRVAFSVKELLNEFYHSRTTKMSTVTYVFLFFPVIRVCGLSYIYMSLHTLTNAGFILGQETKHDLLEEAE